MKRYTQIIVVEDFRSKEPEERRKNLNEIVLQLIRKTVEGEAV
jgi:predicted ABC-class ATPase